MPGIIVICQCNFGKERKKLHAVFESILCAFSKKLNPSGRHQEISLQYYQLNVIRTSGVLQTNILVTNVIFFTQIRRGASGGHAIQHVAVITFTDAVVIIIGAFGYVYAVESYIVITFTIVHRDMRIVGTPFNALGRVVQSRIKLTQDQREF